MVGEFFTELNENVPYFKVLVVGSLLVLCTQLVLLRMAQRRRRACLALEHRIECEGWSSIARMEVPSWWPALLAGASAAGVPMLGLWSVATARRAMLAAIASAAPAEKARLISRSLSGMFNAIPWTILLAVPCVILAIVSVTLILVSRAHARRLIEAAVSSTRPPGVLLSSYRGPRVDNVILLPAMLFVGGLVPVIMAAWHHTLAMIHGVSMVGQLPVAEKLPHLVATLESSHAIFVWLGWLHWPGIVAATMAGAALMVYGGWRHGPSWRSTLLISSAMVAEAAGLFILAAPFRAENHLPWPAPDPGGERLMIDEPACPQLDGPDEIQRAGVLWLNEQQHSLDGYRTDADDIEDRFRARKRTSDLLNPGGKFDGTLLVLSSADLPMQTLMAYLSVAARAHHTHPIFIFTKRINSARPLLGKLSRVQVTGAKATFFGKDDANDTAPAVVLDPSTFRTYGEFAHRLVDLRRAGKAVVLRID